MTLRNSRRQSDAGRVRTKNTRRRSMGERSSTVNQLASYRLQVRSPTKSLHLLAIVTIKPSAFEGAGRRPKLSSANRKNTEDSGSAEKVLISTGDVKKPNLFCLRFVEHADWRQNGNDTKRHERKKRRDERRLRCNTLVHVRSMLRWPGR